MEQYHYKCTLLSDLVLPATAATQGFHPSLDYLPGAKFLGILAKELYDINDGKKTLDLFHNGVVRYGDAHPFVNGQRTYKVPNSWFYPKNGSLEDAIYLHHQLSNTDRKDLIADGKQPKQARNGYFTLDKSKGSWVKVGQNFSIKSAYDSEQLRAKDSQMYGYFGIKQGTEWCFTITAATADYAADIAQIVGTHRMGRSSTAEYGLIKIEALENYQPSVEQHQPTDNIYYLYAESNLCFYDDFGRNTLQPTPQQLQLPDDSVLLAKKSQIRTRGYQTWNGCRNNKDTDRLIIEKGSVFAVQVPEDVTMPTALLEGGVGAHLAEGFGQLVVSPSFLHSDNYLLDWSLSELGIEKWTNTTSAYSKKEDTIKDALTEKWLLNKKREEQRLYDIDAKVNWFVNTNKIIFNHITASQWGMIRNYAKHAGNNSTTLMKILFEDTGTVGCLYRGQSENKWRKNGARKKLKDFLEREQKILGNEVTKLTIKLAAQMAKTSKKQ